MAIFIFRGIWITQSKARSMAINLSIAGFSAIYSLVVMEIVFQSWCIRTDGFDVTLCSRQWFSEYWHPINSHGYRDVEHVDFQDKKVIFIVGDSFAAGHGIKDHRDRFSNVLAEKLGERWEVINLAQRGWDTQDEYHAIKSNPHEPNVIILTYYYNDIEGTATRGGMRKPVLIKPPSKIIRPFIERSYSLNFFYWALYGCRYGKELSEVYHEYLTNAYSDENIWNAHKKELLDIVTYAETRGIEFVLLVFPNLFEIEESKMFTLKVVDMFKSRGIHSIDLTDRLTGRDPQDLVLNCFDAHPNEELNREIGELLYQYFQLNGLLSHARRNPLYGRNMLSSSIKNDINEREPRIEQSHAVKGS